MSTAITAFKETEHPPIISSVLVYPPNSRSSDIYAPHHITKQLRWEIHCSMESNSVSSRPTNKSRIRLLVFVPSSDIMLESNNNCWNNMRQNHTANLKTYKLVILQVSSKIQI
ncbi:hypothetical protein MSG28_010216 [Choristoneura fumiferana]|uniref:Uncharacterized protein n=1 Tax=Choristoneura fumiferana TaxID=7141 RepID=A0ACC0KKE0_CHOFU|nr:hypothetical protein MSG28_010216 [Choristoneura fumiferana]